MRKSLQIFLLAVLMTAFSTAAFAGDAAPAGGKAGVVNINSASAAELAYLPRVGAKAAQRVVEYRTQHGPFRKPSDLMQVKGFGEKTFEGIAPYLAVDGKTTLSAKVKGPRKARTKKPTNTASN
jgi:competence ComEA-like helix-hairpin-helix protein